MLETQPNDTLFHRGNHIVIVDGQFLAPAPWSGILKHNLHTI